MSILLIFHWPKKVIWPCLTLRERRKYNSTLCLKKENQKLLVNSIDDYHAILFKYGLWYINMWYSQNPSTEAVLLVFF